MRGKVRDLGFPFMDKGITPAYAGKSTDSRPSLCSTWDHPRVCGEKLSKEIAGKIDLGSPPRMRGKAKNSRPQTRQIRDHPRVCGEKVAVV